MLPLKSKGLKLSDLEKLISLLTDFKVGFTLNDPDYNRKMGLNDVICHADSVNVDGYPGFYTKFTFDSDGKFIVMGAWE